MLTNWFTFLLYKFLKVSLRRAGKLHGQGGGSCLAGMGSVVAKAWADVPLSIPTGGEITSQASVASLGFQDVISNLGSPFGEIAEIGK